MKKLIFAVFVVGCAGVASAADYTWLANPVNGSWLGAANWTSGEWVADASNTAAFDVSSVTDVDVNGDVAVAGVTVRNAAYTFSNGTLTVNGEFGVGAGATATVHSTLLGTDKSRRFAKAGTGMLVLKGDASTTNTFARFATRGGTLVLDGGVTKVTGPSDGAGETVVAGSFANSSRLEITGGAQLLFTATSSYLSNSGCDLVVSDGLLDCWSFNEFLNGFADNNGTDKAKVGKITVRDKGVLRANQIRIAKVERSASYWTPDYGTINLETGGVLRVKNFTMDGGSSRKTATMNFNGGTLEFINSAAESANSSIRTQRFLNGETASWTNVTLNILEGGLTINNNGCPSYLYQGFKSGCANDGGLTIKGGNTFYAWGVSTYTGGTRIQGSVWYAIQQDGNLGAAPDEPTDNIFFDSNSAVFHFDRDCDVHSNRNVRIADGVTMQIGTQNGRVGRFHGCFGAMGDHASTHLRTLANWAGTTAFDPGEGRTNRIGWLLCCGRTEFAGGTTLITGNTAADVHAKCGFLVCRAPELTSQSFSDNQGVLTVSGGSLVVPNYMYTEVAGGGQVYVTGGVLDVSKGREWLNGLGSPGRTVVQDSGVMIAPQVRISQCGTVDANGEPLCSVQVKTGGVLKLNKFWVDTNPNSKPYQKGVVLLDGGTLEARVNNANFLGDSAGHWDGISVRAGAGGARFDTAGFNISVLKPILSGVANDGGVAKRGAGTLTLQGANTYNGPTRLEGGTLAFARADAFPGGNLDVSAATFSAQDAKTPFATIPELTFRNGCGVRVVGMTDELAKSVAGTRTVAACTTALTSRPSLTVLDADGNELEDTPWRLSLSSDGKSLRLAYVRGTTLILR